MAEINTETYQALASVGAYRVVAIAAPSGGQRRCQLWATNTMAILGVSMENVSTNGSVPVATHYGDIIQVVCDASVSAGAFVGPATATGGIVERSFIGTATTFNYPLLGIATEAGSTNSVIQVQLQPQSWHLNV